MTPNIGLQDEQRAIVITALSAILADEFVLYTKTRQAHWNVTGPQFYSLHQLFQAEYEQLNDIVDNVAERIRQLGSNPPASLAGFLRLARLVESDAVLSARQYVAVLLLDHEAMCRQLRADVEICENAGDAGTTNFLTDLLEQHEKTAWMLRSTLEGISV